MLRLCLVRMTDGSWQQGCVRRRSVSPERFEGSSMVVIAGANGRPGRYGEAAHRRSEECRQISSAWDHVNPSYLGRELEEFFSFVLTVSYGFCRKAPLLIQGGRGAGPKKPRKSSLGGILTSCFAFGRGKMRRGTT